MISPTVRPATTASSPRRLLLLSTWLYRVVWSLVLCLALLNTTFLIGIGYLYLPLVENEIRVRFWSWMIGSYMDTDEIQFFKTNQTKIAIAYFIPALPFLYVVLKMISQSIWFRRLSFGATKAIESGPTASLVNHYILLNPWYTLRTWYRPFGIRGPYFEQNLLLKETIEIVLQTMQGYRMSHVISGRIVSLWFGLLIFINCWSDTIVQLLVRRSRNTLTERLFHVLVDQILDFLWGPVLQAVLIAPYIQYFNDWIGDPSVTINPPKYARAIQQDLRVIAVLSWTNYAWSILPSIVSAVVVLDLMVWLREAEQRLWLRSEKHTAQDHQKTSLAPVPSARLRTFTSIWIWLRKLHGLIFLIVGCTSARYLFFSQNNGLVSCQDRVFAWFTHQEACFVRSIDCTSGAIRGNNQEMTEIFRHMHWIES